MNIDLIQSQLRAAWGESAALVARRPGRVYQLDIPAFLGDGDGAFVFVVPGTDGLLRLTDLGQTILRVSYTRKITPRVTQVLAQLSDRHGLTLEDGRIFVDVKPGELLAGTLGLVQVQTAAEATITSTIRRAISSERFRSLVRDVIAETFAGRVRFDVSDSEKLYTLDAVVESPRTSVGLAIVPSDIEAERAVISKLKLKELRVDNLPKHWVALPRDINQLGDKSRLRLMGEYLAPIPNFEQGRSHLREKIDELASAA